MGGKKPRVKAVYTVEKKLEVLNALCTNCKGKLSLAAMIHDVPKPRLFIHDGHIILCFPPHTSHAMQPLDVACFKPAKATWSDIVRNFYKKNRSESITKAHFASLLNTWWRK